MLVLKQLKYLSFCIIAALATSCQSGLSLHKADKAPPLPAMQHRIALHTQWEEQIGHGHGDQDINLVLAIADDTLISVDESGVLQVLTIPQGKVKWQEHLNKHITAGPAVGEGIVVVVTDRAKVIARSLSDGHALWQASVSSEVLAAPVIGQGLVLVKTIDGKLYAFDTYSGDQKWYYEQEMPSLVMHKDSRPIFVDDKVIVGFADGLLTALNARTGAMMWQQPIAFAKGVSPVARMVDIAADPVTSGDRVFVVSYQGHLSALSVQDAAPIWQRRLSSYSGLAVSDRAVFATDAAGNVIALDQATGNVLWEQKALVKRRLTAPTVINDDVLVVGDRAGYVHAIAISDGQMLGHREIAAAPITTPVVAGMSSAQNVNADNKMTSCFMGNSAFYVLNRDGKLAELTMQCLAEPHNTGADTLNTTHQADEHVDAKAKADAEVNSAEADVEVTSEEADAKKARKGSLLDNRKLLRHRYPF